LRADRRLGLALFSFLLALYLLTYSGRFHSSDGLVMFAVTDNLVRHGRIDIEPVRWMVTQQGSLGPDGLAYSGKEIMNSAAAVPLLWLGRAVPGWGGTHAALLLNPLLVALTGWLLFAFVRRWGFDRRVAALTALLFGVATPAWPYTKTLFSEPLTGLFLLLAAYLLLRYRDSGRMRNAVGAGGALGLALLTRPASVIAWPAFAGLLLYYHTRRTEQGVIQALRTAFPRFAFFPAVAVIFALGYNVARFGSPLQTGYSGVQRFSTPLLLGLAGLTVSPGRSLFLYAPVLLGVFVVLPRLWRKHRPELLLVTAVFVTYVLFYGRWFMWHGGVSWGPRTLVPTIPLLSVLLAPLLAGLRGKRRWWGFGLLVVASIAVQLVGVSVDFDLAQQELLHIHPRLFAPITFFDPRYAQIWLQVHFVRPENFDFAWASGAHFDAVALGISLLVLALCALGLWYLRDRPDSRVVWMGPAACLLGIAFLLTRYAQLEPQDFRNLTAALEAQAPPAPTVLLDDPVGTETFLNLYSGRGEIIGLNEGEGALSSLGGPSLRRAVARGGAIWVISDGPGRDQNAIDRALREQAFFVSDQEYGRRRLTLYDVPEQPLSAVEQGTLFGQTVRLQRVALTTQQRAGGVVALDLRWLALNEPSGDYQVFVHLVDRAGKMWAQRDGTPADGRRPTSTWRGGEVIRDRYALLLPRDIPPGEYRIEIGLYRLADGTRLATGEGADHVTLGPILITGLTPKL